jgi:hypothetical protein
MTQPEEVPSPKHQTGRKRKPCQIGLRTVLLAFVVAALAFGILRTFFYEVEGTNQSYQDARRVDLVEMYLPKEAAEINYWTAPGRWLIMVNFRISEEDFLAWAEENGWALEEIDEPKQGREVVRIYQRIPGRPRPNRSAVIRNGYTAGRPSVDKPELDQVIAYNRDDQRGYFSQFPR